MLRGEILQEIYEALRRANELRGPDDQIACREETQLYGSGGCFDSLGLVSLILDVEMAVNDRTGLALTLADERAMSLRRNPFRDVQSLTDHVMNRLAELAPCPDPQ